MTETTDNTIRAILTHAASLPYAVLSGYRSFTWTRTTIETFDPSHQWTVSYPISHAAVFCEYHGEAVQLAFRPERRDELVTEFECCTPGQWADRGGHSYVAIDLNKSPEPGILRSLVEEAAKTVWEGLGPQHQQFIACNGRPSNALDLVDAWISAFDLSHRREQIHEAVRPAIRLGTRPLTGEPRTGTTRVGGLPDMLPEADWPTTADGTPLTFLAQIDLTEMSTCGFHMQGTPDSGLLDVYSAWGWQEEDCYDPTLIEFDCENTPQLNRLIHTPESERQRLEPISAPDGVNTFAAGSVEPFFFATLPTCHDFPTDLELTDEEHRRFDEMTRDYEQSLRNHFDVGGNHQLGGFASFPMGGLPDELDGTLFRMVLRIGSDDGLEMAFGDDGALTFVSEPRNGAVRLESVVCHYD